MVSLGCKEYVMRVASGCQLEELQVRPPVKKALPEPEGVKNMSEL